jgi:hypothetical protein
MYVPVGYRPLPVIRKKIEKSGVFALRSTLIPVPGSTNFEKIKFFLLKFESLDLRFISLTLTKERLCTLQTLH